MASTSTTTPLVPDSRIRHPTYGLGIVDAVEGYLLRIRFDNGDTLTMNPKTAGIQRATWDIGQQVIIQLRKPLTGFVTKIKTEGGLNIYSVKVEDGRVAPVPETKLADMPETREPDELLVAQQFDKSKSFYYRTMGHYLACAEQTVGSSGQAARIIPKPHQIFVAERVVNAPRQRFLLADEVGLGKTIETGLIIQELRARGSMDHALIVVPANLTLQWLYELYYKFNNEEFKLFDTQRVRQEQADHPGENVWARTSYIVCSHSYLSSHREVWDDILKVPWDMVIFDEAHHIRRQIDIAGRRSATGLYDFASRISQRTRGLLFLTATPMQLHPFELFSLVELLDPALFYNYQYFEDQRARNKLLNITIKSLVDLDSLNPLQQGAVFAEASNLLGYEVEMDNILVSQRARDRLIEQLSSKHLLSEVMIRNRKRLVGGFKRRLPSIVPVPLSEAERLLYDAVIAYIRSAYRGVATNKQAFVGFILVNYQKRLTSSLYAFRASVGRRLEKLASRKVKALVVEPVEWIEADLDTVMLNYGENVAFADDADAIDAEINGMSALLELANLIGTDTKYAALEATLDELLKQNADEQVLIFTQFLDTLTYLQLQLEQRWKVGVFHGAMSPRDKDRAIGEFQRGVTRILVTTEAGGEGRNLQFCAVLVNYDLPWNPMKVEQRIGRLDRIGQERDVRILNFALQGTVEERVLDVLDHRIRAFEETVGGLDPILGQMEVDVQKIILETSPEQLPAVLNKYADRLEAQVERAKHADEALRDFVLDRRSFDARMKDTFDITEQARLQRHINKLSKSLLKYLGASMREVGNDTYSVKLIKSMHVHLATLTRDTYHITFNYQQAMEDIQADYGCFGHPLFDALLAYLTGEEFSSGLTAHRLLIRADHDGFRGFQFNFLVTMEALHTTRQLIPVVVDCDGQPHPELRDAVLDSFDWRHKPQPFDPTQFPNWTALVEHARDAAEQVIDDQLQAEVDAIKAREQDIFSTERQKIDQYCTYREIEGQRKLAHDQDIVSRLQASDRDEDRRVIPLWEGTVHNSRAFLQTLALERQRLEDELAKRLQVSYSFELLNAAWLEIQAPPEKADEPGAE